MGIQMIHQEQEIDTASELYFTVDDLFLFVQECDDGGYDYNIYDKGGNNIDGGRFDSELPDDFDSPIMKAANEICVIHDLGSIHPLQLADVEIFGTVGDTPCPSVDNAPVSSPVSDFAQKNTVWVLHWDWRIESGESGSGCEVYATKEVGLKAFREMVNEIKTVDYKDTFEEADNSDCWEEDAENGHFSVWKPGYYDLEHSDVDLDPHIVKEEP